MKALLKNNAIRKAAAVALALLLWQAGAMAVNLPLLLVTPVEVVKRLFTLVLEASFWRTLLFSFSRIVLGFAIAFAAGCLLGVLSGKWPLLETLLWPYVITIKTVPVASFIIISLIFFSAKQLPTFISFLMVFPVIYSNVLEGIRSTDRELLEMAQVFRVPWIRRLGYRRRSSAWPPGPSGRSCTSRRCTSSRRTSWPGRWSSSSSASSLRRPFCGS